MVPEAPVLALRAVVTDNPPLSARLRASTHMVHAATESAFRLDRWLADRDSYADLLTLLRGFHGAAESALARITGWDVLAPSIDLAARRRAFRIDQDLAELGRPGPAPVRVRAVDSMRLTSVADGLGCLYVIEGSSLGGRLIAARARAVLGPRLPTAFFADPDRNTGQDWNALRASLDAFGEDADAASNRGVIDAAHRTFVAFTASLDPYWSCR
jgi:heme oxygenase (biliverdin-IX-beta and delta-forming)